MSDWRAVGPLPPVRCGGLVGEAARIARGLIVGLMLTGRWPR